MARLGLLDGLVPPDDEQEKEESQQQPVIQPRPVQNRSETEALRDSIRPDDQGQSVPSHRLGLLDDLVSPDPKPEATQRIGLVDGIVEPPKRLGILDEVVEPKEGLLSKFIARPAANVLQGTAQAGADFFGGLDAAAEGLSDLTGLETSGTFSDLQEMFQRNADFLEPFGIQGDGFINDFSRAVAKGAGRLPVDIAQVLSLGKGGLIKHGALVGTTAALDSGDNPVAGATGGLIHGAVQHGLLKVTSFLPRGLSEAAAGGSFAAEAALSGAEGADIAAGAFMGAALQLPGRKPTFQEFLSMNRLFRPPIKQNSPNEFKTLAVKLQDSTLRVEKVKADILKAVEGALPPEALADFAVQIKQKSQTGRSMFHERQVAGLKTRIEKAQTREELSRELRAAEKKAENIRAREEAQAKGKEPSFEQRAAKATVEFYMDTLQAPRVADQLLDKGQNYRGFHARQVRDFHTRETFANDNHRTMSVNFMGEVQSILGVNQITPQLELKLTLHGMKQMGAKLALRQLMDAHGLSEVPKLTPAEAKVYNRAVEYFNIGIKDLKAEYEKSTGTKFKKVKNYGFPIKYEGEPTLPPNTSVARRVNRNARFQKRKGNRAIPRSDFFGLVLEGLQEQQWYIHVHPKIRNIETVRKAAKENGRITKFEESDLHRRFWDKYLLGHNNKGNNSQNTAFQNLLRESRKNITSAILGYKLSSIMVQPGAVFDAMAYATAAYGPKAASEVLGTVTKTWIRPEMAKEMYRRSRSLRERSAGELAVRELSGSVTGNTFKQLASDVTGAFRRKNIGEVRDILKARGMKTFLNEGLLLMKVADLKTAAGTQRAFENILKKHGVKNWREEAEFLMNLTQGSADVSFRPMILNEGEIGKTMFTFQNFFLNRWGLIANDLVYQHMIKGQRPAEAQTSHPWDSAKARLGGLLGLALLGAGTIAEDEARKALYEATTGQEIGDHNRLLQFLMTVPEQIPFFGQMLHAATHGQEFQPPLMRVLTGIVEGSAQGVMAKTEEGRMKGTLKAVESVASVRFGIPGTAQFFDALQGAIRKPKKTKIRETKSAAQKLRDRIKRSAAQ